MYILTGSIIICIRKACRFKDTKSCRCGSNYCVNCVLKCFMISFYKEMIKI